MNIFKICFSDKGIEEDKIQEVIDELHLLGSTFWDDAEDFIFFADGTGGYSWLEMDGDKFDLNGNGLKPDDREVVDFDVWYEKAMKTLKGEHNDHSSLY